jgi:hypothetical protein
VANLIPLARVYPTDTAMRRHNHVANDLVRSFNAASLCRNWRLDIDGAEPWHRGRQALVGGLLPPPSVRPG